MVEIEALCHYFGEELKTLHIDEDGTNYRMVKVKIQQRTWRHVRVVQPIDQGNLDSAVTATKLILRWKPKCIVSFGIAGGFCGDDIVLGDVLVPFVVWYYERGKERKRSEYARPIPFKADPTLIKFAHSLSNGKWRYCLGKKPQQEKHSENVPVLRLGPLASGEKLIASVDAKTRKKIKKIHDKIVAVEMEAAGVGTAIDHGYINFVPKFLVVKGISDRADKTKGRRRNKQWRRYAANAAASFLHEFIFTDAYRNALVSPIDESRRQLGESDVEELSKKVDKLIGCLPSQWGVYADIFRLRKALRGTILPPVFYHWRILTKHIHWIDFCFLLVLRQMARQGYPIQLLVTNMMLSSSKFRLDSQEEIYHAQEEIKRVVDLIFKDNTASITWYSELNTHARHFNTYAATQGFDTLAEEAVRRVTHEFGLKEGNLVDERWLKYIAWKVRDIKRCILLVWRRHSYLHEQLYNYIDLEPAIITTEDIKLGRTLGKMDEPGSRLVINPPPYPEIMSWLLKEENLSYLRDFWKHISLGEHDINSFIDKMQNVSWLKEKIKSLRNGLRLVNQLFRKKGKLMPIDKYRLAIALTLTELNDEFFQNGL